MGNWLVYLLKCSDGSLYCGITNNIEKRLKAHNSGKGSRFTRSRRPVSLVGVCSVLGKSDALKLEYHIKHEPANRKLSVLKSGMLGLELLSITEELRVINKKVQQIEKVMRIIESE